MLATTNADGDDDDDVGPDTLALPPLEDQQRENKAWQDVIDLPGKKQAESTSLLESLRAASDGAAERIANVEKFKVEANAGFGAGNVELALRSYLTGLWLLRLDDPPVPKLLVGPTISGGPELLRILEETAAEPEAPAVAALAQHGEDGSSAPSQGAHDADRDAAAASTGSEEAASEPCALPQTTGGASDEHGEGDGDSARRSTLRATLQVNVSACALKMQDWPTARRACELVLADQPTHVKALYRLARAHDGAGDVKQAISVLSGQLLHIEPQHREARELLKDLRERQKEEKKMFGGLFQRAQGEGTADDGIYSDSALEREARRRKEDKEKLAKIENFAKLPPDMWADTFGDLSAEQMQKMIPENKELARQMPDGGWAKAASSLTMEDIQTAKEAMELHKAQEALKKEGLLPPDEGDGEEGEEGDEWEDWFDRVIGKYALYLAAFGGAAALAVSGWTYFMAPAGAGAGGA